MIASVEAEDLEEDLSRVEASIGDFIGTEEAKAMAGKDLGLWAFNDD
jgi:hypothetical protein